MYRTDGMLRKTCPRCNKKMIKTYADIIKTSMPPQRDFSWWCGCGFSEAGGTERGFSIEKDRMREWESVNGKKEIDRE